MSSSSDIPLEVKQQNRITKEIEDGCNKLKKSKKIVDLRKELLKMVELFSESDISIYPELKDVLMDESNVFQLFPLKKLILDIDDAEIKYMTGCVMYGRQLFGAPIKEIGEDKVMNTLIDYFVMFDQTKFEVLDRYDPLIDTAFSRERATQKIAKLDTGRIRFIMKEIGTFEPSRVESMIQSHSISKFEYPASANTFVLIWLDSCMMSCANRRLLKTAMNARQNVQLIRFEGFTKWEQWMIRNLDKLKGYPLTNLRFITDNHEEPERIEDDRGKFVMRLQPCGRRVIKWLRTYGCHHDLLVFCFKTFPQATAEYLNPLRHVFVEKVETEASKFLNFGSLESLRCVVKQANEQHHHLPIKVGTTLGSKNAPNQYEVKKELEGVEAGNQAFAYIVEDDDTNVQFFMKAVKKIGLSSNRDTQKKVKMITNEGNVLSKLKEHRLSVPYYQKHFEWGDFWCLIMEKIEGENLQVIIKKRKVETRVGLRCSEVKEFLEQMLILLDRLQRLELFHCDIKPANVIKKEELYFLVDFGSARKAGEYEFLDRSFTPFFSGPEVIQSKTFGFKSDIFSLGRTAFECLTGRHFDTWDLRKEIHLNPCDDLKSNEKGAILRLIYRMTAADYESRPSASECLKLLMERRPLFEMTVPQIPLPLNRRLSIVGQPAPQFVDVVENPFDADENSANLGTPRRMSVRYRGISFADKKELLERGEIDPIGEEDNEEEPKGEPLNEYFQ